MKNITAKLLSVGLAAVLIFGTAATAAYAATGKESDNTPPAGEGTTGTSTDGSATVGTEKDETVYVVTDASGRVKKLIVSARLSGIGEGSVVDKSNLSDIENVRGDETFTEEDGRIVWNAEGNDIYYRGTSDGELPVTLKISYFLDGTEMSAADIAGKSGKVTIKFDYVNNTYKTVTKNGKTEKVYVPFAMMTGVLLDKDKFSNVEVSSGKVTSVGDRMTVVGLAFPGLSENLHADASEYDIPSSFEISATVKNFAMGGAVTLATSDIFSRIDTSLFDKADEIEEKVAELTAGMTDLLDGSSALYDGVSALAEKSGELADGIRRLAAGAATLKTGTADFVTGAGTLSAGAKELSDGLSALVSKNDELTGGAAAVFDTLLSTVRTQLLAAGAENVPELTKENYADVLTAVSASLRDADAVRASARKQALATVTAKVEENREAVTAGVTAAVRENVKAQVETAVRAEVKTQVLASQGLTDETYAAGIAAGVISEEQQAAVEAAVDAQMQTESILATVEAKTDEQMKTDAVKTTVSEKTKEKIQSLIDENMADESVTSQIEAAVTEAAAGADTVDGLKAQLDS